jgi:hypothetical protein
MVELSRKPTGKSGLAVRSESAVRPRISLQQTADNVLAAATWIACSVENRRANPPVNVILERPEGARLT